MNASEVRASCEWGWTSYRATGWRHESGRRIYKANFRAPEGPMGFRLCGILFAAARPILALREIANSGRDPMDYSGQVVN